MKNFLNSLTAKGTIIQIGTTKKIFAINGDDLNNLNLKQNLYFLAGVNPEKKYNRADDSDIIKKTYFALDFDLRKAGLGDEEMLLESVRMGEAFDEMNWKWRYCVFTGNGLHFYFTFPEIQITPEDHVSAMKELQHKAYKITGQEPDKACVNIARIFRLPNSYNMKKECGEPKLVEILMARDRDCDFDLQKLADKHNENRKIVEIENKLKYQDAPAIIEAINQIPIQDEVLKDFGNLKFDGKNFEDDKGKRKGFWISKESNLLISGGSDILPMFENHEGFNTYNYRKEKNGMSTKETIEYFKTNYKYLKNDEKIIEKQRQEETINKAFSKTDWDDPFEDGSENPITWGTEGMDDALVGIENNHYVIFGGESGAGKTTFLSFFASQNAKKGIPTLFFSLEERKEGIVSRLARRYAGITPQQWQKRKLGGVSDIQKQAYKRRFNEIKNQENLFLIGGGDFKEDKTPEFIGEVIKKSGARLAIIDNFNKIRVDAKMNSVVNENAVSQFFLDFTNNYKIPCVVIHHYAKGKGERSASSFRGSQKIVDDADIVAVYKRSEDETTQADIALLKDRDWQRLTTSSVYFHKGDFIDNEPY